MATFALETKLTNTMRKRIIKRFAATLLAMFMVFVVAQAADYGFKIGGVSVTSSNASNVTGSNIKARDSSKPYSVVYDAGTNTVTLTNISIIRSGKDNRAILNESNAGLTVVFNGENFLSAENSSPVRINAGTTIKCAGGASGAVTKIYGDEEDAITVGNDKTFCKIIDAHLVVVALSSDAICATSQKQYLFINNSNIDFRTQASDGHALYNFYYVEMGSSNISFMAPDSANVFADNKNIYMDDDMEFAGPQAGGFTSGRVRDNPYYDKSKGFVLEKARYTLVSEVPDEKLRERIAYAARAKYSSQRNSTNIYAKRYSYLFPSDIEYLTTLNASGEGISNAKGISLLTKLVTLNISNNKLTSINLSYNTALQNLNCSNNQLTALDVSGNTQLKQLNCSSNSITKLTANCKELEVLKCDNNQIASLDLSASSKLQELDCHTNELTSLTLSTSCPSLTALRCYENKLIGSVVTSVINSLPSSANKQLYMVYHKAGYYDGNLCTAEQVQSAKNKGWTVLHYDDRQGEGAWNPTSGCDIYQLTLGGAQVSSYNCSDLGSGASYNPSTKVLTLKGGNIPSNSFGLTDRHGLYSAVDGLTIDVQGKTTITGINQSNDYSIDKAYHAMRLDASASIAGNDTLELEYYFGSTDATAAIYAKDSRVHLTIGGNVVVSAKGRRCGMWGGGNLTIGDNATVTAGNYWLEDISPIYNWKDIIFDGRYRVTEPNGAYYKDNKFYEYQGKLLVGETLTIKRIARGDVNCDGQINSADVVSIYNYILKGTASTIRLEDADVNGVDEVNSADVVDVYNIIISGK